MTHPIVVLAPGSSNSVDSETAGVESSRRGQLARPLEIERKWTLDREAMAAALRVVLGLPRVVPAPPVGETR
jgi:hypothetical protein